MELHKRKRMPPGHPEFLVVVCTYFVTVLVVTTEAVATAVGVTTTAVVSAAGTTFAVVSAAGVSVLGASLLQEVKTKAINAITTKVTIDFFMLQIYRYK
jgi:hypothetical protein